MNGFISYIIILSFGNCLFHSHYYVLLLKDIQNFSKSISFFLSKFTNNLDLNVNSNYFGVQTMWNSCFSLLYISAFPSVFFK